MIIKCLQLKNFQKHSDLTLDFKNGVNIVHGKSDAGKSCVRRAIEWCLFGESISGIRKEGSKETSVNIIFSDGIELERVKSKSVNRYILRNGEDEKVYDAIGRSIPDEILDVINIRPITIDDQEINLNVSRQLDPPFLLGKGYSGSFRAKLFNKLTGNDLIDKVLKSFSKDLRQINIDEKNFSTQLEEDKDKLATVEVEYEEKQKTYDIINHKFKTLKKKQERLDYLNENIEKLTELRKSIIEVNTELDNTQDIDINKVEELKIKIDRYSKLVDLKNRLKTNKTDKMDIESDLAEIVAPTLNVDDMRAKIKRLDMLKTLNRDIKAINLDKKSETVELEQLTISLQKDEEKYKEIFDKLEVCPLCKGELK